MSAFLKMRNSSTRVLKMSKCSVFKIFLISFAIEITGCRGAAGG